MVLVGVCIEFGRCVGMMAEWRRTFEIEKCMCAMWLVRVPSEFVTEKQEC